MNRLDSLRLMLDSVVDVILTTTFCLALVMLAVYGFTQP